MTLAPYAAPTSNGVAVATAADQSSKGVARIVQWAEAAEAAHGLAVVLCETAFCPEQFRGKPGEATAAILAGGEVGLSPMASLQSFDIIQGRSAARAITLRAVVLSFGHEIELQESTSARCRMRGRRKGSQNWQEVAWTIERARGLGLTNKSNWKSQPQAMLMARATGEVCRLVAADAILGIAYTAEELDDQGAEQAVQPEGGRRVQRRAQPAPAAALPAPHPSPAPAEADDLLGDGDPLPGQPAESGPMPQSPPVSAAQLRMLGVQWSRVGVTDDSERRTFTGLIVGRDIGDTTKNLTVAEATGLIDQLKPLATRDDLDHLLDALEQSEQPAAAYAPGSATYDPAKEPAGWANGATEEPPL